MGEIDTKPIESVQAALSLFEDKADHRKPRPAGTDVRSIWTLLLCYCAKKVDVILVFNFFVLNFELW